MKLPVVEADEIATTIIRERYYRSWELRSQITPGIHEVLGLVLGVVLGVVLIQA